MPGNVHQELTRMLQQLRANGTERVWLSTHNVEAMHNTLAAQYAPRPVPQPAASRPQVQNPAKVFGRPDASATPMDMPARQNAHQPSVAPSNTLASRPAPVQASGPSLSAPVQASGPSLSAPELERRNEAIENAAWPDLESMCAGCKACPLGLACARKQFSAGSSKARVLFVGDFPMASWASGGDVFAGMDGQMLYKMGLAMGLSWQQDAPRTTSAAYLNILKCRPVSPVTQEQLAACRPFVKRQIELMGPDIIVLMGAMPVKELTGKSGFSAIKGTWQSYMGIPALVIQSPVTIVRYANQNAFFVKERKDAWNTLQEAMNFLGLKK